jgi:broad specificity phosphatase PhoE
MAVLHPALQAGLALLPKDKPLTLLTRHSVRELVPNGVATYDIPLTEEGVLLAEQWGSQLPLPIHAFHSSPVGRCMDTAKAMARGANCDLPVQISMTLVEPGCYVHSVYEIGPLFLKLGPVAFANRHLQEPLRGILSPAAGAAKILQHLKANQGHAGSLTVHVTHDTILAAFIYHLQGQDNISEEDWPWMMEGAWLWFDEDRHLHWVWRAKPWQQSLPLLLSAE